MPQGFDVRALRDFMRTLVTDGAGGTRVAALASPGPEEKTNEHGSARAPATSSSESPECGPDDRQSRCRSLPPRDPDR